jgi:MoxR-like ATPase
MNDNVKLLRETCERVRPLADGFGVLRKKEITSAFEAAGGKINAQIWRTLDFGRTDVRGQYHIDLIVAAIEGTAPATPQPVAAPVVVTPVTSTAPLQPVTVDFAIKNVGLCPVLAPQQDPNYIGWGYHAQIKDIVKSGAFFPVFVTGLSGNGKTMMIEQICAQAHRKYVRLQINPATDEEDLIGGMQLLNGETVFAKGPVVRAMEEGAILLIDEIDRGSNNLMCLQGVLEGTPVLIKKTGEVITPAHGFNVIATANTSGQGDDTGKFAAATVLDEAFLERFPITINQEYPSPANEMKMLKLVMGDVLVEHSNVIDIMTTYGGAVARTETIAPVQFLEHLIAWATTIRAAYENDSVESVISTRRLVHAVKTFKMFWKPHLKNQEHMFKVAKKNAIQLTTNRFDSVTREIFYDLYTKIDDLNITSPEDAVLEDPFCHANSDDEVSF